LTTKPGNIPVLYKFAGTTTERAAVVISQVEGGQPVCCELSYVGRMNPRDGSPFCMFYGVVTVPATSVMM